MLLKATTFRLKPNEFSSDEECSIWFAEFQSDQNIIRLPCDEKHYFHQECIIEWVGRKSNWPLCKAQITKEMINECKKDIKKAKKNKDVEMGMKKVIWIKFNQCL